MQDQGTEGVISELLSRRPEYRKTLKMAVGHEEEHSKEQHYLGWEWFHVETHPAKLVRLVTEGIVSVSFKSNSATCYLLKNRMVVEKALNQRLELNP